MTNAFLIWYIVGIGTTSLISLYLDGSPWYYIAGMSLFFILAIVAGRWEQRAWHDKRRDNLIALREKIVDTV
jgi:membrane protein implicated in regulation of membrane protease activity